MLKNTYTENRGFGPDSLQFKFEHKLGTVRNFLIKVEFPIQTLGNPLADTETQAVTTWVVGTTQLVCGSKVGLPHLFSVRLINSESVVCDFNKHPYVTISLDIEAL